MSDFPFEDSIKKYHEKQTCDCGKPKYPPNDVCYDCYCDMFKDAKIPKEEPDFELKSEVAELSPSKNNGIVYLTDSMSAFDIARLSIPKQYVFNHDV
jgi:hypothetical protein